MSGISVAMTHGLFDIASQRWSKKFRKAFIALLGLAAIIVAVLALPVAEWRTGRNNIALLSLAPAGLHVVTANRVWVDTDAACGASRTTDPDDCLALLALLKAPNFRVVGISTIYGNASIEVTYRTTRQLVGQLASEGFQTPPVYRGLAANKTSVGSDVSIPAEHALRDALAESPMVIVALGPLTNIAAVLRKHPHLASQVQRIIVVMGQQPGHVFHPVEGGNARILFGHGPVFKDFNFAKDPSSVATLLALKLPMTFIPYEGAQKTTVSGADLDTLEQGGTSARWAAERSRDWLAFWREDIRQPGFYPFDLVVAAYLLHPELFQCAQVQVKIRKHSWYWRWRLGETGLFVDQQIASKQIHSNQQLVYCPSAKSGLHDTVIADLMRKPTR